jgi:hypothetical protein
VSRFWRIDANKAVLDCKKNFKTFLEKVFVEILRRFLVFPRLAKTAPRKQKSHKIRG